MLWNKCHCSEKGDQLLEVYLHDRPALLAQIQAHLTAPLADAAAVNSTRWKLYQELLATSLPVEVGTGGRTRWNRSRLSLPKTHWLDAAAVGSSTPERLSVQHVHPLFMQATGWQRRQMCLMNGAGFPRSKAKQHSRVKGFRTGDLVRAVVPSGKKAGRYEGRVAVRASGSFNITTAHETVQGINARYCRILHHQDGYTYAKGGAVLPLPPKRRQASTPQFR